MNFGENLAAKRNERGLSIRDVEAKTGINNSMICRYEQNSHIHNMSVDHAKKLSKLLRWDLRDMINDILVTETDNTGKKGKPRK